MGFLIDLSGLAVLNDGLSLSPESIYLSRLVGILDDITVSSSPGADSFSMGPSTAYDRCEVMRDPLFSLGALTAEWV